MGIADDSSSSWRIYVSSPEWPAFVPVDSARRTLVFTWWPLRPRLSAKTRMASKTCTAWVAADCWTRILRRFPLLAVVKVYAGCKIVGYCDECCGSVAGGIVVVDGAIRAPFE